MNKNNEIVVQGLNLRKTFADGRLYVEVLKEVNLEIKEGELVAIIGPSGSGKSTLLHLLGGLDKPTRGHINICGTNINKLSEKSKGKLRNKYLGFVYQFHHLLPEFSVLENVCMPLLIGGINIKEAQERAIELLTKVGLKKRLEHRIGEISGGERQRVAIARALITKPACVLADEPTGNLDHKTAEQVFELILSLNQELGTAFLIVTHDLSLAKKMHRQLLLKDGCLV